MKAIGYAVNGTIDREDSLIDFNVATPVASGRDILVKVDAISVNPVDYKIRTNVAPATGELKIIGWDAAGTVESVGSEVTHFSVGDKVWYAGDITRPGCNAEYQLVDERVVSLRPTSLSVSEAAALPLTAITAWEVLFDRLRVSSSVPGAANAILITGAAGGVGSIAIQLLRTLTDLTIIATASRPETKAWVTELGAHYVIDHTQPLAKQVEALGIGRPAYVFSIAKTTQYLTEIAELISPQGRLAIIDDFESISVGAMKLKSVSVHWESMFTRTMYKTADIGEQGALLGKVANLIDQGKIRTTLVKCLSPINAKRLKEAHAFLESGRSYGKLVIEGF
jgi:NADPH:quinone reductase